MNFQESSLDWAGAHEGRASEVCRRITFLVLFTPEGMPRYWLIALGVLACLVAASNIEGLELLP